jgi:solute carrier family 25 carnitine/acylcarnitine transporter 20/29
MVQSVNFAVYDSCRRTLYNLDHPQQQHDAHGSSNYLHNDSLYNVAASSMVAGSILACFTSPMLIVKTQQQVHGHSFRNAVQAMIRPDKAAPLQFRNMFVGFGVHSFSEIIGRAVYFVTYEHLKRSLFQYRQQQDPDLTVVNLSDRMASAAMSGILCWAAIFPIDAVRCRLYAERPTTNTRLTAVQMARHMYQQAGWRAFYRGFGVTVLRAGPVAAAVLPVYDLTLETLSSMD